MFRIIGLIYWAVKYRLAENLDIFYAFDLQGNPEKALSLTALATRPFVLNE